MQKVIRRWFVGLLPVLLLLAPISALAIDQMVSGKKLLIKNKNPDVKVEAEHGLPAYQGQTTGAHPDAIRAAMKFAFGKGPVFVREGGSIGAVVSMENVIRAPVFFLGLSPYYLLI